MMKKRKGASTVLVLFMIVVLVTLGFFTIMSATLNYKLSLKASAWNKAYYELDSQGEAIVAEIDNYLYLAEQDSVKYFMQAEYKNETTKLISDDIHQTNRRIYNNDIKNSYKVLNNTYKSLAIGYLEYVEKTIGGDVIVLYNQDGGVYSISYENVLQKMDNKEYKLSIKLNVVDILYDIYLEGSRVNGKKIDFKNRYVITMWEQYLDK